MDERYYIGLLAGIFMGWFAIGVIFNLRRGEGLLRWMRGGLPKLGERTTFRWLGSSVAETVIEKARSPFRRVETLIALAPRDIFWMMIWARLQGRRDTLIFRCALYAAPRVAIELADPDFWTGRAALAQVAGLGWEVVPTNRPGSPAAKAHMELMVPQGLTARTLEVLPAYLAVVERLSDRPYRFSLRRDTPTLELHLPLPDLTKTDAPAYFETLRELGKVVMEMHE
jgi:hypothetical protein